jgi:hypothetical protein
MSSLLSPVACGNDNCTEYRCNAGLILCKDKRVGLLNIHVKNHLVYMEKCICLQTKSYKELILLGRKIEFAWLKMGQICSYLGTEREREREIKSQKVWKGNTSLEVRGENPNSGARSPYFLFFLSPRRSNWASE